jgi:hypothetical protein
MTLSHRGMSLQVRRVAALLANLPFVVPFAARLALLRRWVARVQERLYEEQIAHQAFEACP